jgi:hypothetical protein
MRSRKVICEGHKVYQNTESVDYAVSLKYSIQYNENFWISKCHDMMHSNETYSNGLNFSTGATVPSVLSLVLKDSKSFLNHLCQTFHKLYFMATTTCKSNSLKLKSARLCLDTIAYYVISFLSANMQSERDVLVSVYNTIDNYMLKLDHDRLFKFLQEASVNQTINLENKNFANIDKFIKLCEADLPVTDAILVDPIFLDDAVNQLAQIPQARSGMDKLALVVLALQTLSKKHELESSLNYVGKKEEEEIALKKDEDLGNLTLNNQNLYEIKDEQQEGGGEGSMRQISYDIITPPNEEEIHDGSQISFEFVPYSEPTGTIESSGKSGEIVVTPLDMTGIENFEISKPSISVDEDYHNVAIVQAEISGHTSNTLIDNPHESSHKSINVIDFNQNEPKSNESLVFDSIPNVNHMPFKSSPEKEGEEYAVNKTDTVEVAGNDDSKWYPFKYVKNIAVRLRNIETSSSPFNSLITRNSATGNRGSVRVSTPAVVMQDALIFALSWLPIQFAASIQERIGALNLYRPNGSSPSVGSTQLVDQDECVTTELLIARLRYAALILAQRSQGQVQWQSECAYMSALVPEGEWLLSAPGYALATLSTALQSPPSVS